jgi:PAS domain S-box-containing protein
MPFNLNEINLNELVGNMPDQIFYLGMDKKLLAFNAAGEQFLKMIGCENPVPGDDILNYYPADKRKFLTRQLTELQKGSAYSFEDSFISNDELLNFNVNLYSLTNKQGGQTGFCVLIREVTDNKRTEEKYRRLFQKNPMVIYIIRLSDSRILEVNEAAVKQYGYSREELLQKTAYDLRHPEDSGKLSAYLQKVQSGKLIEGAAGEWRHTLQNGEIVYMQIYYHWLKYNNEEAVMVIAQNVTEKTLLEKRLKEERRFRQHQMTEAILLAQETERAGIGRELHDNINQILGAARLYIASARQEADGHMDDLLEKASEYILNAVEEIRKLSKNLVNPLLSQLGLASALNELIGDIMLAQSVTIWLDVRSFDESDLDEKLKLNIFRIIQEQLNNILKYASADNVNIKLSGDANGLSLQITDDGQGFDTKKNRKGIGLTNILSRVELYKGNMEVVSSPGTGCRLSVFFPGSRLLYQ